MTLLATQRPLFDSLVSSTHEVETMPQMCQQFCPCSAVPPEWLWLMPVVMPPFAIVLVGVCPLPPSCTMPAAAVGVRCSRSFRCSI
jgi:hypothetical protein